MEPITEIIYDYRTLMDTFGCDILVWIDDGDYQGDTHALLRQGDEYGILTFGWGSCSGCDTLAAIAEWGTPREHVLRELTEFRDRMYDSITWRPRRDMEEYIAGKDFTLEFYWHTQDGQKFIQDVQEYFR